MIDKGDKVKVVKVFEEDDEETDQMYRSYIGQTGIVESVYEDIEGEKTGYGVRMNDGFRAHFYEGEIKAVGECPLSKSI